jgi:SAM-dependent methyltransferase
MDPDEYRRTSRDRWEAAARGWGARRAQLQRAAAPVSQWLVEALVPQPGQTILELAAGPADTGLMAAELVRPGGRLLCTDFSEAMLDVARERARELGIDNVEFRVMDAESMDLETASVDGAVCRWGFMLMADPAAALSEARRVLRPGGRLALAAWDVAERNLWASRVQARVGALVGVPPPGPEDPHMFAFADPARIEALLAGAGFLDVEVEDVSFEQRYASFEDWWEATYELSRPFAEAVDAMDEATRERLRDGLREDAAPHAGAGGALVFPARTHVAAASA